MTQRSRGQATPCVLVTVTVPVTNDATVEAAVEQAGYRVA